jgi:hypothetical protein
MNTIELTDEIEVKRWSVPAWMKLALYISLGAATYQGLLVTYEQAKEAFIKAKYSYISSVISEELDGKSFKTSTDMRDNKKHQFGDMTGAQMSMAIWTLSNELSQCESLRATINEMTVGIQVVR